MDYNHALESFYNSYGEYILFSLSKDYRSSFSFKYKSESAMLKAVTLDDISTIITSICDNLIRNGNYILNYNVELNKNGGDYKIITFLTNRKLCEHNLKFVFPHTVFSDKERVNIIKKLTLLNPNELYLNFKGMRYVKEMDKYAKLEIGKLNDNYFQDGNCFDYYSEYYCVYRIIKHKIGQRKLLDYVIDTLNRSLVSSLNLQDDDIILFEGITISELEILLTDLEERVSISKILKALDNDWIDY